jgi:hypothetical protein
VYGVCVDPFLDYRVASRYDNHVVIWDTRNFEKPIVTLTQPRKEEEAIQIIQANGAVVSS